MTSEPRHRHFDSPLSEWIEGFPHELDTDAVALSSVIVTGRDGFGFEGEALIGFVRQALTGILEQGGRPVHGGGEGPHDWILQPRYGSRPAEILEAFMAEWLAAGMPTGDQGGLWFALPQHAWMPPPG
jgi:hypothetical protein